MFISQSLIFLLVLGSFCFGSHSAILKPPSSPLPHSKVNHLHIMKRQEFGSSLPTFQKLTRSKDGLPSSQTEKLSYIRNNIPNILSLTRLAAIPMFVAFFLRHSKHYATGIFVLSSLTDFLDGYIARKYHLTSEFGAFLDPVADKVQQRTEFLLPLLSFIFSQLSCIVISCIVLYGAVLSTPCAQLSTLLWFFYCTVSRTAATLSGSPLHTSLSEY
jgi:hypothetical protein